MHSTRKRVYWPELDGLRFFAFMLVFVSHLGHITIQSNFLPIKIYHLLVDWGWIGVELFFALSGFLISYIISEEISTYNSFDIKRFYIRRVLRIWPLAYLILFLGLFVLPMFGWFGILIFSPSWVDNIKYYFVPFLLFLGNFPISIIQGGISPAFSALWTVSIEEQYYLAIGFLRKRIKSQLTLYKYLLVFLVMSFSLRVAYYFLSDNHLGYYYNTFSHLDGLLIGSATGIFYHQRRALCAKLSRLLMLPLTFLFVMMFLYVPTIFSHHPSAIFLFTFLGFYFSVLVVYLLNSQGVFKKRLLLNNFVMSMGRISYGLYLFHMFSVVSAKEVISRAGIQGVFGYVSFSILALAMTIALSYISYNYFELRFLRKKIAYERVPTHPIADDASDAIPLRQAE